MTPRLRGLLALNIAASSPDVTMLVNSLNQVHGPLGLNEAVLRWTMAAFGAGSLTVTLALPRLLACHLSFVRMVGDTVLPGRGT